MGTFDFNKGQLNKRQFSKELGIILESSCVNCFRFFDQKKLTPFQAYPCQHVYCKQCVDKELFPKGELKAECKDCKKEIQRKNIKQSMMILKVLNIFRQNKGQQNTPADWYQLEIKIAHKLLIEDDGYFYSCPICEQPYDRVDRLPNIVCWNQHLLCTECLKKSNRFNKCLMCDQEYLKEFFTNKLIINASEFIHKKLFSQTVKIVVNEKEFTVVTHSQTTIKDIFHILQEFDHISNKLEIKLCKFQVEKIQKYDLKREQVNYNQKIGSGKIKKIFLRFDEAALSIGANVTMSSKFLKELPIKIKNFEQERRPNLEVIEEEDFGKEFQNQSSILHPRIPEEPLRFRQEEIPLNGPEKSQVSKSKLKLLEKSRALGSEKESERSSYKKSSIKRKKQAHVGTQINPKFIENINTKLGLEERQKILPLFLQKHQVQEVNQKYLCYEVYRAMNMPFTKQEVFNSQKIQTQIYQKAKKEDLQSLILYVLKKELEDGQIRVIFNPKSSIRSQLTLKTLTSHILTDRFMVTQKIDEDEEFFFEKMNEDQDLFRSFIEKHTLKYCNKFGLSEQNIVIHNLVKGSNILTFSTNQGDKLCKYLKNNLNRDIQIHAYFTQLQLSPEDLDSKGYIKFLQEKNDIEFRGNWPYYQPIRSLRHGIKVLGKFDNGDNVWLKMINAPREWAVGFHGIRNPNQAYKQYKNVILSILNGLHQPDKSMLIVVENSRQAYSYDDCVNKIGQKVGDGVYLTPLFAETLPYTTPQAVGEKSYHLVFQCRLNPKEIRIPSGKQDYWIVRHSAAIRPYGIVLIETKERRKYPSAIGQFGETFSYAKYKDRIEAAK